MPGTGDSGGCGRVVKGETLLQALERKLKEELGILLSSEPAFLTVQETIFKGEAPAANRHSVNVVYKIEINDAQKGAIRFDRDQMEEVAWFPNIDPSWHACVRQSLALAGFV